MIAHDSRFQDLVDVTNERLRHQQMSDEEVRDEIFGVMEDELNY